MSGKFSVGDRIVAWGDPGNITKIAGKSAMIEFDDRDTGTIKLSDSALRKAGPLFQRLERYYQRNGISPTTFKRFGCPYKKDCVSCATSSSRFVCGREALVTSGYEGHALPRLLFLSADSGSSDENSGRKAVGTGEWEERECVPGEIPRPRHWREVHEIARWVLRCFRRELTLDETRHFIAHTNSAKCCVNNRDSRQAPQRLFDNCRRFIGPELTKLAPDLLVTQGEPAERAIEEHFTVLRKKYLTQRSTAAGSRAKWYRAEIRMDRRRVLWLRTPHPGMRKMRKAAGGGKVQAGKLAAKELDRMYKRCFDEVLRWKRNGGSGLAVRPRVLARIAAKDRCPVS